MVTSGLQIDMRRQMWFLEKIFPVLLLVFVCFERLYAYGNVIKISENHVLCIWTLAVSSPHIRCPVPNLQEFNSEFLLKRTLVGSREWR